MRWQEVTHIFHNYNCTVVFETDDLKVHYVEGVVKCRLREQFAYLRTGDIVHSIPPYAHVIKMEK